MKKDIYDWIEIINGETEWNAYIPRGKNAVAIVNCVTPNRRYFKNNLDFIMWARAETE